MPHVGHVSMKIYNRGESYYISFWPKTPIPRYNLTTNVEGRFVEYSTDFASMKREPDQSIVLYSLKVDAIAARQGLHCPRFSLFGATLGKMEGPHNCSSLVYGLLVQGGLRTKKLLSRFPRIRFSLGETMTPIVLSRIVTGLYEEEQLSSKYDYRMLEEDIRPDEIDQEELAISLIDYEVDEYREGSVISDAAAATAEDSA